MTLLVLITLIIGLLIAMPTVSMNDRELTEHEEVLAFGGLE